MRARTWIEAFTALLCCLTIGWSGLALAHHGGDDKDHSEEIPANALIPSVRAQWLADSGAGAGLQVQVANFRLLGTDVQPSVNTPVPEEAGKMLLQGHIHLIVNGEHVARVYGDQVRLPAHALKEGLNSVTLSVSSPDQASYTWHGKPIQTTLLVDTRTRPSVKNRYVWPAPQ